MNVLAKYSNASETWLAIKQELKLTRLEMTEVKNRPGRE